MILYNLFVIGTIIAVVILCVFPRRKPTYREAVRRREVSRGRASLVEQASNLGQPSRLERLTANENVPDELGDINGLMGPASTHVH